VNNKEIAKIFQNIADILELKGENTYKTRAYQSVARTIKRLPVELDIIIKEGRLREVAGVGEAIENKIFELVTTGKLNFYEKLKAESPTGLFILLDIPGIGPKTAMLLINELDIESVDDLEKAILDGRITRLPRIGKKTAENILYYIGQNR
jgi:DNA polymerase (family 10)